MLLEVVPLYSGRFYSTLLIIKDIGQDPSGLKDEDNTNDKTNVLKYGLEKKLNEVLTTAVNVNAANGKYNDMNHYTYTYDYINNKKDYYAAEKQKNIYILINCGWDDNFCINDVKNIRRVCDYIDLIILTNHGIKYMGALPLIYLEMLNRKKKFKIVCHEYVHLYSKSILLSYFLCNKSSDFFRKFSSTEYFDLINSLFRNVVKLEYKEICTFRKKICKKRNIIFLVPFYILSNGDNLGSSAIIMKLLHYKILFSINFNIVDYSYIDKTEIFKQKDVFLYITNFQHESKKFTRVELLQRLLNIANRTINRLGCIILPIDFDSLFIDLLFHIHALLSSTSHRYNLLLLSPFSERFAKLLVTGLTYMNENIRNNFHRNRINMFKLKNLICIKNYKEFKKYENGYYVLFSFPSSLHNDSLKKILSTFLKNKKNAIIFTKEITDNSFAKDVYNHYSKGKTESKNMKQPFRYSFYDVETEWKNEDEGKSDIEIENASANEYRYRNRNKDGFDNGDKDKDTDEGVDVKGRKKERERERGKGKGRDENISEQNDKLKWIQINESENEIHEKKFYNMEEEKRKQEHEHEYKHEQEHKNKNENKKGKKMTEKTKEKKKQKDDGRRGGTWKDKKNGKVKIKEEAKEGIVNGHILTQNRKRTNYIFESVEEMLYLNQNKLMMKNENLHWSNKKREQKKNGMEIIC